MPHEIVVINNKYDSKEDKGNKYVFVIPYPPEYRHYIFKNPTKHKSWLICHKGNEKTESFITIKEQVWTQEKVILLKQRLKRHHLPDHTLFKTRFYILAVK